MTSSPDCATGAESARRPFAASAAWLLVAAPAFAQTSIGPSKCTSCHDHERQATKWQKEEPAALGGRSHFNTRKQLEAAKAAGFAKAIGLGDPYDLKGACVKCHGTVFRGDVNAGVSCESCHGPASGYYELHQVRGSYAGAVAAGMHDLRQRPAAIARVCVECHVTVDARLSRAGHPSGAAFDVGVNLQKIVHWGAPYDYAQLTAEGRAATARRLGAEGGPAASAPAAAPAPAKPAPAQPATTSAAPSAPVARGAASAPAPPAAEADPWDWDQPIRPLPKDYVPEPVLDAPTPIAPPAAAPTAGAAGGAIALEPAAPEPAPARASPPKAVAPAPSEPVVPPSLAEETPLLGGVVGVPHTAPLAAAVAPAARAKATLGTRPPVAEVAELRGRGAVLLDRLLRAGARAPGLPPAARPVEFRGPDSELLRLQDEVLALALEALRRP